MLANMGEGGTKEEEARCYPREAGGWGRRVYRGEEWIRNEWSNSRWWGE